MGWWSEDIMGGDTPLDIEGLIYDFLKIEFWDENDNKSVIPKEAFKDEAKLIKYITQKQSGWGCDTEIFYQVVAVLMMRSGAPISEKLKGYIYEACDDDDWAVIDNDRYRKIEELRKAVQDYDGINPVEINSKGLFEVMMEHGNN